MNTPSSESSYVIPVMTPQVSVVVLPGTDDAKERKMQDQHQLVGATHVTDMAEESGKDWDIPFFGCFSNIMPNCCMSTVCPCVSIAQIQARLGKCYMQALLSHGATIFGLVICMILFISHSVTTDVVNSPNGSRHGEVRSSSGRQVIFLCGAAVFALFYSFSVCLVRMSVRKQYEIKGHCAQDCLVSTCCAPCTVAQMASQTQSYTPGIVIFNQPGVDILPGYPVTPLQFI
ncbi:PLAC8 family protein [Phytophthora palmivora]|uniref:PLAC8 family protein n=1 Tax=Phytophthora palmivora TaxID=4796 RepID=A0A2P4XIM3_9STRA|nr:PLAC8 family protein [Phytophthora palmivora]